MTIAQLIPAIIAATGTATGLYGIRLYWLGTSSEAWPSAWGVLQGSQVIQRDHRTRNGAVWTDFQLMVRYRYVVGDKAYGGKRLRFSGNTYREEEEASIEVNHLRLEAPLPVYYDPDNPKRSVLERGVGRDTYVLILASIISLLAAAILQWGGLRGN